MIFRFMFNSPCRRYLIVTLLMVFFGRGAQADAQNNETPPLDQKIFDVVIYGGSSAGIAAAVQVRRMGGTVLVVEPGKRIGGLTTGGLGQTDIGNKAAIGGISREFYQAVSKHYEDPAAWKWQKKSEYQSGGQSRTGKDEDAMWTFEPSVALKIYKDWVNRDKIKVVYQQSLNRSTKSSGVEMKEGRIVAIKMETGEVYRGKVFIDATYEGDLLAAAGVEYTVGRESNSTYGETLNGVQTARATHHQFMPGVDPYVKKGDSKSGLLPGIDPKGPGTEGSGDHRVQAYCFRMCITDHPENRIPFFKPQNYNELDYELLLRNFEAGAKRIPWSNSLMPNRKTDTNNNRGFSTDFIGQNYDYPEGSYEQRRQIVERHRHYQKGLMWTLAYHPRVPDFVRNQVSRWGTCKDEFEREDGWQLQLYIREARRMIGHTVMTQHHCQGRELAKQPIGMAAYTMDSHNVQRHLDKSGFVKNEGDVQVGGFSPYPIDYGSIIPKKDQCENLVVPVCLSASHMAFGSIRMEPVFMVLGQSGATAAMQAIEQDCSLQDINYEKLREKLIADKQRLVWTGPKRTTPIGLLKKQLKGIVLDDEDAIRTGFQTTSGSVGPFVELGYRHDGNQQNGAQTALFKTPLKIPGTYEVRIAYSPFSNRATNVPVVITHQKGETRKMVNQQKKPTDGPFVSIGQFEFGKSASVKISNAGTDGFVLIDAVQFIQVTKDQ